MVATSIVPCAVHHTHTPRPSYSELHHVVPQAWQIHWQPPKPWPNAGASPDHVGVTLWDARTVAVCRTGHGDTHWHLVRFMRAAVETADRAVIVPGVYSVPLRGRGGELAGYALVDEEDASVVAPHRWTLRKAQWGTAYARASIHGQRVYMHRLLMQAPPEKHVHHRNAQGLDNRRANLLLLTPRQHLDLAAPYLNASHVCEQRGRWRAYVDVRGKRKYIGMYAEEYEAREAASETVLALRASRLDGPEWPDVESATYAMRGMERWIAAGGRLADLRDAGLWGSI